jgi:hypothetical protein
MIKERCADQEACECLVGTPVAMDPAEYHMEGPASICRQNDTLGDGRYRQAKKSTNSRRREVPMKLQPISGVDKARVVPDVPLIVGPVMFSLRRRRSGRKRCQKNMANRRSRGDISKLNESLCCNLMRVDCTASRRG